MKIKNFEIEGFMKFLFDDLQLAGKASKMRTRFIELLEEKRQMFEKEKWQILMDNSNKDESGQPKKIIKDGIEMWDIIDEIEFNQDWDELAIEDVIIEENDERKDMLLSIQESVLNCTKTYHGREATFYSRFCDIVEEIQYK